MKNTTLFRKVLWFETRLQFDINFFDLLQPRREVSHKARYRSGVFHSEKCGREIQYESGLELDFIRVLEESPNVVFYWEQPVAIPYWRGKLKARTYPDFGVYLQSRHFVLVEVKPLSDMLDHRVQAKAEGIMDFCSRHSFGFLLTDGKHTPQDLLKSRVNRKLEREIMDALSAGPISEQDYREIKMRTAATPGQLYRAIIRLDLRYSSYRFKLKKNRSKSLFRQVFFERKKYEKLLQEEYHSMFGHAPKS